MHWNQTPIDRIGAPSQRPLNLIQTAPRLSVRLCFRGGLGRRRGDRERATLSESVAMTVVRCVRFAISSKY